MYVKKVWHYYSVAFNMFKLIISTFYMPDDVYLTFFNTIDIDLYYIVGLLGLKLWLQIWQRNYLNIKSSNMINNGVIWNTCSRQ